jgi:hypothetical protein
MTDLFRILKHQLPQLEELQCLTLRFNPKKFFTGQKLPRDNFFSSANPNLISDVLNRYISWKTTSTLKFQNSIKAQSKHAKDLCPNLHKSSLPALKVQCYKTKRDALLLDNLARSEADIEMRSEGLVQSIIYPNPFIKKIGANANGIGEEIVMTPPKKTPKGKRSCGYNSLEWHELYGIKMKLVEKESECEKDMNLAAELLFQSHLFAERDTDVTINDELTAYDDYVRDGVRRLVGGNDWTDRRFADWDRKMKETQALVQELRSET